MFDFFVEDGDGDGDGGKHQGARIVLVGDNRSLRCKELNVKNILETNPTLTKKV